MKPKAGQTGKHSLDPREDLAHQACPDYMPITAGRQEILSLDGNSLGKPIRIRVRSTIFSLLISESSSPKRWAPKFEVIAMKHKFKCLSTYRTGGINDRSAYYR